MITDGRLTSQADADDIRVEQIAAQLEEAEQQRLTDYRIEEQQHPADDLTGRSKDHDNSRSQPAPGP
jgi:hypothetical protein